LNIGFRFFNRKNLVYIMFPPSVPPQGPLGTFPSPLRGPWECWASIGTPQSVLWMSRFRTTSTGFCRSRTVAVNPPEVHPNKFWKIFFEKKSARVGFSPSDPRTSSRSAPLLGDAHQPIGTECRLRKASSVSATTCGCGVTARHP
jgi:hypothetical protein